MKAITEWEPYATLIVSGLKLYETRSRRTSIRGTIAIHAAARPPLSPEKYKIEAWNQIAAALRTKGIGFMKYIDLPRGAVVGTVEITGCEQVINMITRTNPVNGAPHPAAILSNGQEICGTQLAYGDFTPGRWVWMLKNPKMFETPVPAKGRQGFWNWEGK